LLFKIVIGSIFLNKDYSVELNKHMYLFKGKHLCWKLQYLAHCFPLRTELVFKEILRETFILSWRYALFNSKSPIQLS
jgi:hypothetical protein